MKNKKLTYGLLAFVLVVWTIAIYQIIKPVPPAIVEQSIVFKLESDTNKNVNKNIELDLSYPDPFLSKKWMFKDKQSFLQQSTHFVKPVYQIVPKKVEQKKIINWPDIKYGGLVNKKLLLTISNKQHIVLPHDKINNIEIKTATHDSVLLIYQTEQKIIYKNTQQ